MKISFDENVCKSKGITFYDTIALAFIKNCFLEQKNPFDKIQEMIDRKMIFENQAKTLFRSAIYYPISDWDKKLQSVIIDSEESIPQDNIFEENAKKMRGFFPPGKMPGTSNVYYRGSYMSISNHLKKWWKLYNSDGKYTFDDILKATEKYTSQFEGDKSGMRSCMYFVLKDERRVDQNGKGYVEQLSDLSVILENMDSDEEDQFIGF